MMSIIDVESIVAVQVFGVQILVVTQSQLLNMMSDCVLTD